MKDRKKLLLGQKAAEKVGLVIAGISLIKALVGLITKSAVLLSDAIHSGSDLVSVISSWLSLKIAQQKPSKKFPYGFYKAENLAALLISFLIFWAGWGFLREGLEKFLSVSRLELPYLALMTGFIGAVSDFLISRYLATVAKKIGSSSLAAAAKEKVGDIFVSATVLVAIFASIFQIPYIEGGVIIFISLILFKIALETGKESILVLMDAGPEEKLVARVAQTINQVPGVAECLELKLRYAGAFLFGEAKVGIRRKVSLAQAHQVADRIEEMVLKKFPQIVSLVVHLEPFISDYCHLVIPVKRKGNLSVPVEPNFGQAPFLLFVNLYRNKIKGYYFFDCSHKNSNKEKKSHLGLRRAKLVAQQQADLLIAKNIGEIAFYTLQNYLVDVYSLEGEKAQEVIEAFIQGKLKQITTPKKVKNPDVR